MTATATPSIDTVTFVPLGTWVVDAARSTVGFEVRHIKLAKVRGRFRAVEGTICHDGNGLSIHGTVDVGSIDTGEARRDVRLREEGFFDVERHPTIAIEAVSGPGSAAEDLAVYGTITIRGVERPVEFDVDGPAIPVDGDGDLRLRLAGA